MIIDKIFDFHRKYFNLWVNIDGSARGFITSLKIAFGENPNYEKAEDVLPGNNKILPVNFSTSHKQMISHLVSLMNEDYIGIPQQFDKLIVALRSAIVNEYSLDKESSVYNDIFDAARLSLKAYNIN